MSDTGTTTPTGLTAVQKNMLAAGFEVTLPCGTRLHPKAESPTHEAQPTATKPAAKTAPAKPKREVPPAVRRTWKNKKAFKAMKGKELPAKLHGKTTYTQREAIDAGLLTEVTRKPTAKARRLMAGGTKVTVAGATEMSKRDSDDLARLKRKGIVA